MKKLANPTDNLPPFGQAHYFERRDGNAALIAAGFTWNQDEHCWMRRDDDDVIRASVRWSQGFNRFYIASVL